MYLGIYTATAAAAITTDNAALIARLTSAAEKTAIGKWVTVATEDVERITGRALINRTYDLVLDGFPEDGISPIELPFPPLSSITSVSYTDTNGATQTLAVTTGYLLSKPTGQFAAPAQLWPAHDTTWPSTDDTPNAVTIRFVAGYGAADTAVPQALQNAVATRAAQYYEGRDDEAQIRHMVWPYIVDVVRG